MSSDSPLDQKACRRELALSHIGIADRLLAAGKYLPARRAFEILRGKYFSALTAEESLKAQELMLQCEAAQVGEWILTGDNYAKQNLFEDAIRWYEKVRSLTFSSRQTLQAEERIRAIQRMAAEKLAEIDRMSAQKQYRSAMQLAEAVEKAFPREIRIQAMRKFADASAAGGNFELAANKLLALAEEYGDSEDGILAYAQVGYMYAMQARDLNKGMSVFQAMSKWRASDERAQRESQLGVGILLALMGKKEEATQILTAVAIKYKENKRVAELCRDYIWKCKNCESIAL